MEKLYRCYVFLVCLLINGIAAGYDVEFNANSFSTNGVSAGNYVNNIPEGWAYESSVSSFNIAADRTGKDNVNALKFNFYNVSKGKTGDLKMGADVCVPQSEIVCDNIAVTLMLYVQPIQGKSIDTFQLIATTNEWEDVMDVWDAIPIRDDSYEAGWKTFRVLSALPGVSQVGTYPGLKIGVRATAGGQSMTYGYLHRISIEFVACASPVEPYLVSMEADIADPDAPPLEAVIAPGAAEPYHPPQDSQGDKRVFL